MNTPKEIVDFSVEYICRQFELNGDKRGVLHEKITSDGENALIDHFNFSLDGRDREDTYCLRRLFIPAYWVFLSDYALQGGFPSGGGNPKSGEHYWHLRDSIPDRDEFKNKVLKKYESYLAENLKIIQSSS